MDGKCVGIITRFEDRRCVRHYLTLCMHRCQEELFSDGGTVKYVLS